eukprot:354060-Chlamydomonas_euryale.AAC.15
MLYGSAVRAPMTAMMGYAWRWRVNAWTHTCTHGDGVSMHGRAHARMAMACLRLTAHIHAWR